MAKDAARAKKTVVSAEIDKSGVLGSQAREDSDEADRERRQGNSAEKRIRQFMREQERAGVENLPDTPVSTGEERGAPKTSDKPTHAFQHRSELKRQDSASSSVTGESSVADNSPKAHTNKQDAAFDDK